MRSRPAGAGAATPARAGEGARQGRGRETPGPSKKKSEGSVSRERGDQGTQPGPPPATRPPQSSSANVQGKRKKCHQPDQGKVTAGVKRKSDVNLPNVIASAVANIEDIKRKKVKKQDNKAKEETQPDTVKSNKKTPSKTSASSKKITAGSMVITGKDTGTKMTHKSNKGAKSGAKTKQAKTAHGKGKTLLKVSKKIFSSKLKKGASSLTENSKKSAEINSNGNEKNSSSQENVKKAESKSVKIVKKPNKDSGDSLAKLKKTEPDGKVKKRKLDKKTLAKRKLSRMKKAGYLAAPPRRSAALNASAIMNCIFDKQTTAALPKPIKIKEEVVDSEDDETCDPLTNVDTIAADPSDEDKTRKLSESSQSKTNCEKPPGKTSVNFQHEKGRTLIDQHDVDKKVKRSTQLPEKKSKPKTSKLVKEEDEEDDEGDDECDISSSSLTSPVSVYGGRRMASLNASAMMNASFGREERRARRDPLTIAIEASLKDMKEKEEKQQKEESGRIGRISSTNNLTQPKSTSENIKSSSTSKLEVKREKVTPHKDKIRTENDASSKPLHPSPEVIVKEEISSPSFASSSMEGLSESDIKTKLIESASAKIKSKISRQSSEEKLRKKIKKTHPDRIDEKVQTKSKSDVGDHPPIRRKSGASVQQPSSHGDTRGDTKAAIKLELVPGVEKTSKLESVSISASQSKTASASVKSEVKQKLEISKIPATAAALQHKVGPGTSCTIITGSAKPEPKAQVQSGDGPSKLSTIKPVSVAPVRSQQSQGVKVPSSMPTATVQPTLTMKPVVGTVAPRTYPQPWPGQQHYLQQPGYGYYPAYYSAHQPQHFQQQPAFQPGKGGGGGGQGQEPAYPGYFLAPQQQFQASSAPSPAPSQAQGFLCGPYNYPYSGGRVIGPIIAIAPGSSIPVGSVAATPILNIPTATSAPASQQQQAVVKPELGSGVLIRQQGEAGGRPQGKAMPIMAASVASGDPALFRQILPKNSLDTAKLQAQGGPQSAAAGARPMQVVGPISASSSSLVATVLPTPVSSLGSLPHTVLTAATATTTSITKILSHGRQEQDRPGQPAEPVIVNQVLVPPPPSPLRDTSCQAVFRSFLDSDKLKLESAAKEAKMKSILNIPSSLKTSEAAVSPIVTVTVRSKASSPASSDLQHVIKRPKDWKEVVKSQSSVVPRPGARSGSLVTPLRVPRPSFQFLDQDSKQPPVPASTAGVTSATSSSASASSASVPTFHIPQKSDSSPGLGSASEPRASSLGHPGLPCGLQRMTSSLMQNSKSPTKMTLKEMKRIPAKVLGPPMSVISPCVPGTSPEVEDRPPKLLPQVSLASASAPAVRASSPGLARSRLQLKPATSPKLELEQYLTVTTSDPAAVSQLAAAPDLASLSAASAKPRKAAAAASPGARLPSSAPSPAAKPEPAPASASPLAAGEKKTKRDSLTRKSSAPVLIPWSRRNKEPPRRSGGWSWKGDSFLAKVHLNNEELPVERICYPSMRHEEGDEEVAVKDCILLASGNRKKDLPFIAKVTALWENPDDGEMMMSLLWFYRPEHTDIGRQAGDCEEEVFASKHRDHTSVACIEDKCFVMTFNEYCRYMRFSRMMDEGVTPPWNIVPELPAAKGKGKVAGQPSYPRAALLPTCQVAHDRVFLCRKVYDPRGRRMYKNPY